MTSFKLLFISLFTTLWLADLFYPNGQKAWNGTTAYHDNSQTAWNGSAARFRDGQTAWNGSVARHPSGQTAWNGSTAYYEKAQTACRYSGGSITVYHPNGQTATNGTSAKYANGQTAISSLETNLNVNELASVPLGEFKLSDDLKLLIKAHNNKYYLFGAVINLSTTNRLTVRQDTKTVINDILLGRDIHIGIIEKSTEARKIVLDVLGIRVL